MPELPDVEAFRRYVDATSRHQKIKSVAVRNERFLGRVCARKLQRALNFRERFEGTRGEVGATLMNQKILAGIGNVYSDEILFQARLHPEMSVAHLDGSTLEELHKEIRRELETAIEREADPHSYRCSFLLCHRHEGERCPRGHGKIQKTKAQDEPPTIWLA